MSEPLEQFQREFVVYTALDPFEVREYLTQRCASRGYSLDVNPTSFCVRQYSVWRTTRCTGTIQQVASGTRISGLIELSPDSSVFLDIVRVLCVVICCIVELFLLWDQRTSNAVAVLPAIVGVCVWFVPPSVLFARDSQRIEAFICGSLPPRRHRDAPNLGSYRVAASKELGGKTASGLLPR